MKENLPYWNSELAEKQATRILELFKNVQKALKQRFEKIAQQYGFTVPQLCVILHLYETPSITLHELSSHMMLTKSTVSGIVDRLTKQGVVIREIPKDNRRTVKLSISEEFKKANDISNMKKELISHLILKDIKSVDSKEVEKIISGLTQFSLLLNNDNKVE